ncbi:helix-turn-helix domain-containing protein [Lutibacter oricola]|nr:helix-turn-helix domain-containing protein [Lutibacter oricola]
MLAFYPLYYLYLYSAFNFTFFKYKWIYHFTPAIVTGVLMLIFTSISSWEEYHTYMNSSLYETKLTTTNTKILTSLYKGSRAFFIIQILLYNFLAIRFILKAKKDMSNLFSNLDKYQTRYFYITNISFISLMSLPSIYVAYVGRIPFSSNDHLILLFCTLFTTLYVILATIGINQIPAKVNISEKILDDSNLHDKELEIIKQKLINYFQNEKPWLIPQLNIWDVAKNIGTNRSYISKTINEKIGCNFNQFVNSYRINEAKLIINKSPNLSISEISEQVGFGSVNSFIRIFKSFENATPTEYKKSKT